MRTIREGVLVHQAIQLSSAVVVLTLMALQIVAFFVAKVGALHSLVNDRLPGGPVSSSGPEDEDGDVEFLRVFNFLSNMILLMLIGPIYLGAVSITRVFVEAAVLGAGLASTVVCWTTLAGVDALEDQTYQYMVFFAGCTGLLLMGIQRQVEVFRRHDFFAAHVATVGKFLSEKMLHAMLPKTISDHLVDKDRTCRALHKLTMPGEDGDRGFASLAAPCRRVGAALHRRRGLATRDAKGRAWQSGSRHIHRASSWKSRGSSGSVEVKTGLEDWTVGSVHDDQTLSRRSSDSGTPEGGTDKEEGTTRGRAGSDEDPDVGTDDGDSSKGTPRESSRSSRRGRPRKAIAGVGVPLDVADDLESDVLQRSESDDLLPPVALKAAGKLLLSLEQPIPSSARRPSLEELMEGEDAGGDDPRRRDAAEEAMEDAGVPASDDDTGGKEGETPAGALPQPQAPRGEIPAVAAMAGDLEPASSFALERGHSNPEPLVDEGREIRHQRAIGALTFARMPAPRRVKEMRDRSVFEPTLNRVGLLMFDLVGFTRLSAEMGPHKVVAMLDELYDMFDKIVERRGALKVETIGDAFLVCCGAPDYKPSVDAAVRITKCALDMMQRLKSFRAPGGRTLQGRIGIHSGPVLGGVIGVQMPRYQVFGPDVDYAMEMESSSEPGEVHASADILELLVGAPDIATSKRLADGSAYVIRNRDARTLVKW